MNGMGINDNGGKTNFFIFITTIQFFPISKNQF